MNRSAEHRRKAAVPLPSLWATWVSHVRGRLRGEGRDLARLLALTLLAALGLLLFRPRAQVLDELPGIVYWAVVPLLIGIVASVLLGDLTLALRERRAALLERERSLAEAQRLEAAFLYNLRLRKHREANPGFTVVEQGRLGRWQPETKTFNPVELPPELEELRQRAHPVAQR